MKPFAQVSLNSPAAACRGLELTHTLLTISPRVEPYRCAQRPPPRAIAQRFSALARLRHADEHQECLLIGVDRKRPANGQSDAIEPNSEVDELPLSHSRRLRFLSNTPDFAADLPAKAYITSG
jgi:hypothetical protein